MGLFAVWVGFWGYVIPAEVANALPWSAPPLHARVIGSLYVSGTVFMFGSVFLRSKPAIDLSLAIATVWTGMLLLVSLLHWQAFDFSHTPVWFWFFAYIVFPITGGYLYVQGGAWGTVPGPGGLDLWARRYVEVQSAVCFALAAVLFLMPGAMTTLWPWKLTPLLAQVYSGPFLAYGAAGFLFARLPGWKDAMVASLGMLTFAAFVLVASLIHRPLFANGGIATIIWFLGFAIANVMLAAITWRASQHAIWGELRK